MRTISSEEKRQHSSKLMPYSYYYCSVPAYFTQVPLHWHGEFEINYILKGRGEFICGDERYEVKEGDILIFQPNKLHAMHSYKDIELYYDTLVFSPELLGASENDRCAVEYIRHIVNNSFGVQVQLSMEKEAYEELKSSIEIIFSCAKGNSVQHDLLLKSELLRLFWLLECRGYICHHEQTENSRSEVLRPVLEYINENFREMLSIEQLAGIANMSKSYFMGCFKQVAGMGAMEYIIRLRIENACRLLEETQKTAAEIAFYCGFGNLSNFNRHFKKIVGCTPNEYRNSIKRSIAERD